LELALDRRRAQIDPADDALHERVLARELEQELRLRAARARLHGDAAAEAVRAQLGLEVRGQEVAPDARHARADPAVVVRRVAPEVLVSVEAHGARFSPLASRARKGLSSSALVVLDATEPLHDPVRPPGATPRAARVRARRRARL